LFHRPNWYDHESAGIDGPGSPPPSPTPSELDAEEIMELASEDSHAKALRAKQEEELALQDFNAAAPAAEAEKMEIDECWSRNSTPWRLLIRKNRKNGFRTSWRSSLIVSKDDGQIQYAAEAS